MVGPTMAGLEGGGGSYGLYEYESIIGTKLVVGAGGQLNTPEDILQCDVQSTPHPVTGLDPDGKDRADAMYVAGRGFTDTDVTSPFFGTTSNTTYHSAIGTGWCPS